MTCKLLNQDCIQFLKQLPDESVDLVVTDPPYFIGYDGGKGWDSQWETEEDYLDWCKEWTSECARVLKPGKCLYVWGTTKTDTFLKYKLDVLNSLEDMVYQNWIIWAYDWGGRTKKKFPRKHEDLLMYSKGKEFDFFADSVKVERAVKSNMNLTRKINLINKFIEGGDDASLFNEKDIHSWKKYNYHKLEAPELKNELDKLQKKDSNFKKGKIPTDVWTKNNHTTSIEYCGWHPTQKPISLLERVIKAHTSEGDIVVDIFSGTASTMIACQNTGRNFIGTELDPEYYNKSIERFEKLTGIKYK
jgi:site-specific DNA-methyltransferase (adenine-specific)